MEKSPRDNAGAEGLDGRRGRNASDEALLPNLRRRALICVNRLSRGVAGSRGEPTTLPKIDPVDLERLRGIAAHYPFRVVMAGKVHPKDFEGKAAIRKLHEVIGQLSGSIACAYLCDYNLDLAKTLVAGCDVWLNTPQPPMEASGTSGMKAALNGVLNLSTPDGWWVETHIEGVTGWSIGNDDGSHENDANELYEKLSGTVLPLIRPAGAQ